MAARKRKTARPLLTAYLEDVSARTLETYRDLVRDIVDREHGLYALYKGKSLYYVGLASNLRSRVDRHL